MLIIGTAPVSISSLLPPRNIHHGAVLHSCIQSSSARNAFPFGAPAEKEKRFSRSLTVCMNEVRHRDGCFLVGEARKLKLGLSRLSACCGRFTTGGLRLCSQGGNEDWAGTRIGV